MVFPESASHSSCLVGRILTGSILNPGCCRTICLILKASSLASGNGGRLGVVCIAAMRTLDGSEARTFAREYFKARIVEVYADMTRSITVREGDWGSL